MKLTKKSEYALLALIHIARQQDGGVASSRNICDQYEIPKKYLESLLGILKNNGLIKSQRGPEGGHRLAVPAKEISLARIIRLMDGALAPTESASKFFYSPTPIEEEKKALNFFKEIRNYVATKLENAKLSDLI